VIGPDLRGRLAERAAALLLALRGYRILARRYATHVGEIDLVAQRGRLVVFVEVKAREELRDAFEAVRPQQRRRIERAAAQFLASRPGLAGAEVRFDVVAFDRFGLPRHLPDAWRPEGGSG
jgi:putative endonuclease